jgi:hypothetical protein
MKIFILSPSVKRFSNGRLIYFFHSYKNDFCTTLQIEPSYLLLLNHNLKKYRIDVMNSDTFRYA